MKNTYVAPVVELATLASEDVVMISGVELKESGVLTEISWSDLD